MPIFMNNKLFKKMKLILYFQLLETNLKNILEVACGGGRILVPLAQAGYKMTGFDFDEPPIIHTSSN